MSALLLEGLARFGVGGAGLAVVALGVGVTLVLLWITDLLARRSGLSSDAQVVSSDTGQATIAHIWDPVTGLHGKPDYVLRERRWFRWRLVPVELKPSRRGGRLHESDEMQLVVYLLLLRARFGRDAARYGYVRYAQHTFRVDLTAERVQRCLQLRDGVRATQHAADVARSHAIPGRCAGWSWVIAAPPSMVSA